ncbi:MAG: signal peptidase I [Pseudomonadota bacterium]
MQTNANPVKPRKPVIALLMSLVLPGFGQLYNGDVNRAIWLFLCFAFLSVPGIALVALYVPSGWMLPTLALSLTLTLAVWFYGMFDAWRSARHLADFVARDWQTSGMYMLILLVCNGLALPALIGSVRTHQVESFRVPSASMNPGIVSGDVIFADKRYNCPGCKQGVKRGDIAIFASPNDRSQYFIKRIIGLPGDHIQIKNQQVWVNGSALSSVQNNPADGTPVTESIDGQQWQVEWKASEQSNNKPSQDIGATVPAGQVFMLGDKRNASMDSRLFGTVSLQDVLGKARQIWFSSGPDGVRWDRLGMVLH